MFSWIIHYVILASFERASPRPSSTSSPPAAGTDAMAAFAGCNVAAIPATMPFTVALNA